MTAFELLSRAWTTTNSLLCVGLDTDPAKLPQSLIDDKDSVFLFNKAIVNATHEFVCCYKLQFAFYGAAGREHDLERTIQYIKNSYPNIPLILDSKRSDIGNTCEMYAKEAFVRYGAHMVTVNPYLGSDCVLPFLAFQDNAALILCKTSNSGARDFQDLDCGGKKLYLRIAEHVAGHWNARKNLGLVVGATYPAELAEIRAAIGDDIPILLPGIGAQGGDVGAAVKNGRNRHGNGLMINSSRGIIYKSSGDDFADAARAEARRLSDEINQYR